MSNKRWFLPILLLVTMLLAACGAAAQPTDTPPATTAGTAQEDDGDDAEPVATEAPAATTAAEPTDEPTEEPDPTAAPTEEGDDDDDDSNTSGGSTIEDADDIQSYRFRAEISATGDAFEDDESSPFGAGGITIEGAFTKDPKASDVSVDIPGLGEVGFREVDDKAYSNFGGMWTESSPNEALNIDDFTPLGADELGDDLSELEEIGEEDVNGRDTTHYRGDKDVLQALAEEDGDDSFDFDAADEAQLDVWLDNEYGFIVKMELNAEGTGLNDQAPDASGRVEFLVEYYDFNADDIVIEVPEDVMESGDSGDSGDDDSGSTGDDDTTDASTLPELLGFDIELPEGAESEVSFGTATLTLQMPREEAQALIEEAFEGAGYTLDSDLSSPDAGVLWYDNGEKQWYITLTETDGVTEVFIF